MYVSGSKNTVMNEHVRYFLLGPTRYIGNRLFDRSLDAVRIALADVRSAALSRRHPLYNQGLSTAEKEVMDYVWLMFSFRHGDISDQAREQAEQSIEKIGICAVNAKVFKPPGWRRYSRRMSGLRRKMNRFYRLICTEQFYAKSAAS